MAPAPTKEVFLEPLNQLYNWLLDISPGLIWFGIIVIAGYLISAFIGWIIRKLLYKVNVDKRLRKLDLHDSIGDVSIAKLAGIILKWYIFILFLDQAVDFLDFGPLSVFISRIVSWMPSLILGVAIIIAGLILIDFIVHKMLELRNRYIKVIANIIKVILIIVVIFTAIEQLGIKTDIAKNIFLMVIGAVLITFSLALGIGLGMSLKDELRPFIKNYRKKLK
ncbi:hypothetical protein GF323_02920 [Candidatus Woesearchaeota archaeon]|nr:hypothetical protein [Candidatus Woesearchaeota archaeon]